MFLEVVFLNVSQILFVVKEYKGQHYTTLVLGILPLDLDPCLLQNYAEV